ncbi:5548_t:CDS:2 [Funneliformis mosseae]|uniref:5548_t:CDS:1 n=1 Tax=Funneliformis mosseae TaxID=27381 RepID=A0A9N9F470_FUNMO|nr:5548_t:CDS:2 [Funneliformis mosseae]
MSDIKKSPEFDVAAKEFEELVKKYSLPNEEKLEGYALFKQGSVGDNTKAAPGFLSAMSDKAKSCYINYTGNKSGTSPEDAQAQYIAYVAKLKKQYEGSA